jgi:hypothetical protein
MALPRAALTMDWDFSTGANCCSAAKRSFVAGFSGSGETISGCATDNEFQRAKHLAAVA